MARINSKGEAVVRTKTAADLIGQGYLMALSTFVEQGLVIEQLDDGRSYVRLCDLIGISENPKILKLITKTQQKDLLK